jgi:hypothetical protein
VHAAHAVPPGVAYCSGGHSSQNARPARGWYVRGGQGAQPVALRPGATVPGAQVMHARCAAWL